MPPSSSAIAIIAGVGSGTGASVARKFAEKYIVYYINIFSRSKKTLHIISSYCYPSNDHNLLTANAHLDPLDI